LLKNIHHLAANFYDRNGLLINASKRYRKAKKLRKLRKSEVQINDGEVDDTEQIAVEDTFVERQRKVNRDMYRVLDGSVLVAIGVTSTQTHSTGIDFDISFRYLHRRNCEETTGRKKRNNTPTNGSHIS